LKRFLAFGGSQYYPGGGWNDFVGDTDSAEEAIALLRDEYDWWNVIDTERALVVAAQQMDLGDRVAIPGVFNDETVPISAYPEDN